MIKKILFAILLSAAPLTQAFIVDIQVLTKQLPDGTTHTVYLFGDDHRPSILNKAHKNAILKIGSNLAKSVAFIVEDSSYAAPLHYKPDIAQTYLLWFAQKVKRQKLSVTNVEFRPTYARTMVRGLGIEINTPASAQLLAEHIAQSISKYLNILAERSPFFATTDYYARCFDRLDAYKACKNYDVNVTTIQFPCSDIAASLIDARILDALFNKHRDKKNHIVCAGAAHTRTIARVLHKAGYTKTIFAFDPVDSVDNYECVTWGNALKRPQEYINPQSALQSAIVKTLKKIISQTEQPKTEQPGPADSLPSR